MRNSVCGESARLHRARVAAVTLAIVFSSSSVVGQTTPSAAPPGAAAPAVGQRLRPNAALLDEALRMRLARGDLTTTQADAELRRQVAELAARASTDGRDPTVLAEHRREAAAYFAHVEQAVRSASHWPSDQPSEKYETKAIGQLEQARGDYAEAMREGKDPRDALRLAEQVLAWTRGETEVPAGRDVFAGEEERVTAALQAGTAASAPTPVPPAVAAPAVAGLPAVAAQPAAAAAPVVAAPPVVAVPPAVAAPPVVAVPPAVAAPAAVAAPPVVAPPALAAPAAAGAGTTAIENSPTYSPKDEALDHKRKADESEDLATSLKEYQEALKIEPRYAPWWSNLGEKLGDNGRWQEAETAFRRAVELNPNEPEYRANLALALLRQGRREEAIKDAKAAREMARAQNNALHASHPVYAELTLQVLGLPADPPPVPPTPAPTQVPLKQQKTYRGLKFSVAGVKRVKEFEGAKAEAGKEIVVVSTVIDRSDFKSDFRGNECRLDRAVLVDAADERYKSAEQQRRVTVPLRNENGTLAGTQALPYDWSFEVPEGARLKTFKFVFADERVNTGGADPDENVTDLSFDLE